MADFSTWDRATLEQFAHEATAKLIENRAAINELVEALECIASTGLTEHEYYRFMSNPDHYARKALAKHSTTNKEPA